MDEKPLGGVLVVGPPDGDRAFDASLFARWEHPVDVCSGPDDKSLCPLLGGQGCQMFEAAHGIVFKLDLDRAQHRAILRDYRELSGEELPIRVLCTKEQAERFASLLADVETWDHEPTTADLDGFAAEVEAVDRTA